jgi:invasion protein IalB
MRRTLIVTAALVLAILSGGIAVGQDDAPQSVKQPAFSIKPSDVVVPDDVPIGQYRRIIRPFQNWTLICDENLKRKQRVCNISQTVIGQSGGTVFSWSLAGTQDGQPMMILRTPPQVGEGKPISLSFDDKTKPITITTSGCDQRVCIAMLPVGPRMKGYIEKQAVAEISFGDASAGSSPDAKPPATVVLHVPLNGLSTALAAI